MGIVTADISVTLDGFGAGPNQRPEAPFGDLDEERLHSWQLAHAEGERGRGGRHHRGGRLHHGPQHVQSRPRRVGPGVGGVGGARTRRTTLRCSCSPTTSVTRCRWRVAPRSTS